MAIYMKADNIIGNVTTNNFKNWIEIDTFQWSGIRNRVNTEIGVTQDRVKSAPEFGRVILTKPSDKSSIYLFTYAFNATNIKEVTISFVSTGNPVLVHESYVLSNTIIADISVEHDRESNTPHEYLILDYDCIQRSYYPFDDKNQASSPIHAGYDLAKASKL